MLNEFKAKLTIEYPKIKVLRTLDLPFRLQKPLFGLNISIKQYYYLQEAFGQNVFKEFEYHGT